MSAISKLAKGASITFIGMVLSKIFGFVYRLFLGQELGPGGYGLFTMGLAFYFVAQSIAQLSLDEAFKRFMPEQLENSQHVSSVLYSGLRLIVPLGIVSGALLFLSSGFIGGFFDEPGLVPVLEILAIAVPFGATVSAVIAALVAHQKMRFVVYTNHIAQNLVKIGTAVIAVFLGLGIAGVTAGFAVSVAFSLLLAAYFAAKNIDLEWPSEKMSRDMLGYSWPILLTGMIGYVLNWTDTLMLGHFMTSTEVGVYNAAFPLAATLTIFLSATKSINFPIMSQLYSNGEITEMKQFYRTNTRWALTATAPAFLLLFLFPRPVIALTFGQEFVSGAVALRILSAGFFITTLVGPATQMLKTTDNTRLILYNDLLAAAGNVALNFTLIPIFGVAGAAAASLVSNTFRNLAAGIENLYFNGVHAFDREMVPLFAASLVALVVTYSSIKLYQPVTPLKTLLPGVVIFGAVYASALILLGGVKEEDRDIIIGAGKKIGREDFAEKIADLVVR